MPRSVWSMGIKAAVAMLAATIVLSVDPGPPLLVPSAHAANFTVDSHTDAVDASPGDGVCATAALPSEGVRCTSRAAIQEANAQSGADTIQLPAGVFMLTIVGPDEDAALSGDLDVLGDLTLTGAGAASTVIDANQIDRILHVASGVAVEVRGVTLRNGRAFNGGGIASDGYQLSLVDSVVANNVATGWFGGGIQSGDNLVLTRSVVTANTVTGTPSHAGQGGGILGLTVTLIDSTVADNIAGSESPGGVGGGIHSGGRVMLTNSTVSGNRSIGSNSNQGGGIWTGILIATNSVVSGNTAIRGNGGGTTSASATLLNTTISGNSVTGDGLSTGLGGGLWVRDSEGIPFKNVTVYANSAPTGSGVFAQQGAQFINSLVAGNTGSAACSGSVVSHGHNLESGDSCGFHGSGDLTNTDPKVGPLAFNGGPTMTHALQPGSPAIDAGDGTKCPATDQRGVSRPADGDGNGAVGYDVGAFESPPWPCGALRAVRVAVAGDGPNRLRATLTPSPATGTPPNTLQRLRIIGLDNVVVDIGSQTFATPGVDVPISPNSQQLVLIVRRPSGSGPGTARLVAGDSCGEWPTFVGGGANAWSGGSGSAGTIPSTSPVPAGSATPAPICQPRPAVSVATHPDRPGRLRVVVTTATSQTGPANELRRLRFGAFANASIELDGNHYVNGDFEVSLPDGTRDATFFVEHLTPRPPTTVPFTVIDSCGQWPTFIGGGAGVP